MPPNLCDSDHRDYRGIGADYRNAFPPASNGRIPCHPHAIPPSLLHERSTWLWAWLTKKSNASAQLSSRNRPRRTKGFKPWLILLAWQGLCRMRRQKVKPSSPAIFDRGQLAGVKPSKRCPKTRIPRCKGRMTAARRCTCGGTHTRRHGERRVEICKEAWNPIGCNAI